MRRFFFALVAGGSLWLSSLGTAVSQDALPVAASQPAPAAPVIEMGPEQPVVSLDGRSRYWIDPTEMRTADQVEAAADTLPWALRRPGDSYNIDGKALWFQFDLHYTGRQRPFVQLTSSGVDRAQLFYRDDRGQWVEQEAGDSRPVSQWPVPGRFPTFELSTARGQTIRYWLRVEHARVDFAAPIALYERSALLSSREREQFLLGGYFGLALLIALVAAANAAVYRDRSFGVYSVYVTSLAVGQLAYLGVGAQHVWDELLKWNEIATFLLPVVSAAAGLWFVRTITEPARYSKALDLTVWSLIAALLSAAALDTVLASRTSLALAMAFTLLAMVTTVALIVLVWRQREDPHIRLIALGFVPVIVAALFPVARGLNLIPAGPLTRYAVSVGAAIEMPILFYALSLRGARRREAQVRAAALSHTDPLTGLAHERSLMQRLDSAIVRARGLKHACALMAVKLSNFDAILHEFGRDTADRALVVAASVLRQAITDVDMAARVGAHEFALLLEGPATTGLATSRAQQVVAGGLRSSAALPAGVTLKFHVTIAMLPDRDLDATGSLQWLREGVNAMAPDSRKLIRALNF